ncbi:MAG: DUF3488 and transglutaminase-like domain-containing protein [Desulfohalobiaceae bacterium]|nr:DUF3488 and transglutaminase-like domain-containing protein [Desulfohalobiaceae bacterium]
MIRPRQIREPTRNLEIILLLAAVFAPFALWMPLWVSGSFLALLGLRAWLELSQRPLPSRPWRILLALAGLAAVFAAWGGPFGLRPGSALFLLMIALKSFEQNSARDREMTVLLCCFLPLAGTLFSQSLGLFLYNLLLLGTVLFILQRLQRGSATAGQVLARTGRLLVQALPLAAVLFLLFPRVGGGLLSLTPSAQTAYTGLSQTLAPGDVAHLATSREVAFRVKFQKGIPDQEELYWRSLVLTRYDGSRWRVAEDLAAPPAPVEPRGNIAEYRVDLQPTGRKYLPALDLPLAAPEDAQMRQGYSLHRKEKVTSRIQYGLRSATRYSTAAPRSDVREAALEIEERANPRTQALVRRLERETSGPRELVDAVMHRFAEGEYLYTRNPPLLREEDPVDHFLFQTKQGFCGHYAQALAWAARAAGIPARVVTGYLGGTRNPLGDYWILRQSDAHAWVEVYFSGAGWVRKDPTRSLSPDQIVSGEQGDTTAADELEGGPRPRGGLLERALGYAGLAWDAAYFGWNYWVLGFTQERQLNLLARLRLGDSLEQALPRATLLLTFLFLAFMLILMAALLGRRRGEDGIARAYTRFLKKLRRAGIEPRSCEGPLSLDRRIEAERPDLSPACRKILQEYIELRYAGQGDRNTLRSLRRRVRRFSPPSRLRGGQLKI